MSPIFRTIGLAANFACAPALVGCAIESGRPDVGAPLVTFPIKAAGIQDARLIFAGYFGRELDSPAVVGGKSSSVWDFLLGPLSSGVREDVLLGAPSPVRDLAGTSVLVVPGIFGDCVDEQSVPFGDGMARPRPLNYVEAYRAFSDLGLADTRALRIPTQASSATNGALIARELVAEAARPDVRSIVVVAYSKGVPDTLHALVLLEQQRQLPAKVQALVSVAGVVMGTPIADRHAGLYDHLAGLVDVAGCSKSQGGEVESLAQSTRMRWLAAALPLPNLRYYSLVAIPDEDRVAPGLRAFHNELGRIDRRNDGQVIASEAILPRSQLVAELRSDHWDSVLPLDRHPIALVRSLASGFDFPREALFRAIVRYVADDLEL